MRFGNAYVSGGALLRINQIASNFYDQKCRVVSAAAPDSGRSAEGNQYRLEVSNGRFASIKLAYDTPEDLYWEVFMSDMRKLLGLAHYSVEAGNSFPLDGWLEKDYIIMDWGPIGRRLDISRPEARKSIAENSEAFLSQMGRVAAQNFLFATYDRKKEHFIWDLDDHTLFSIDHEITTADRLAILFYFRDEMKCMYGDSWFDDQGLSGAFGSGFTSTFRKAEGNRDAIALKYDSRKLGRHGKGFIDRINYGARSSLQRIMS